MDPRIDLSELDENGSIAEHKRRAASGSQTWDEPAFVEDNRLELDLGTLFDAPGDPAPMTRAALDALVPRVQEVHQKLKAGLGDVLDNGVPMLGWQDLPERLSSAHLSAIRQTASEIGSRVDAFVSLGIGGSYLGLEAALGFLNHVGWNSLSREERGGAPKLYFLGQNMDPDYIRDTLDLLRDQRIAINVISKSGTTTETAIAFRLLRSLLTRSLGPAASEYIVVTTDARRGALRALADEQGWRCFEVPEDIGGRFSVLSDVGLFGMAVAGVNLEELLAGARFMKRLSDGEEFWKNPVLCHAAARTLAATLGKKIEVVATNSTALYQVARFMEQLFPESEGHAGHGLWVSPSLYSEKLHANGQLVQQGERNLLETFLRLREHRSRLPIPEDPGSGDGLEFLAGRDLSFINGLTIDGPAYAHFYGGVPSMTLTVPRRSAYCLGQLFYFLMRSVAVSGTLLGHNPFIQPGVVAYKQAMFALAGKPGHEAERARMQGEMASRPRLVIR